MEVNIYDWYFDVPIVTRAYLTLSFLLTAACALDFVSFFSLYWNGALVLKGEVWRLLTTFLFFGGFGLSYILHQYFFVRYSRSLEESFFRGRPADFLFMLVFGGGLMLCFGPLVHVPFFGKSLSFMLVYLWARRNPLQRMSLFGLVPITAPFLPWVLLAITIALGSSAFLYDIIGIACGHVYFFFEDVFPSLAHSRGWRVDKILPTPTNLRFWLGHTHAPPIVAHGG